MVAANHVGVAATSLNFWNIENPKVSKDRTLHYGMLGIHRINTGWLVVGIGALCYYNFLSASSSDFRGMKILQANSGVLTNFDVLNFLKSKGASKDLARVLANVAPSEYKVFDYLVATPACTQTRESIDEFKETCREYDLAEAEVLNIINARPYNVVGIFPMIEDIDNRLGDKIQDLVDMVVEVLPSLPVPAATYESEAKTTDAEKIEDENDNDEEEPIETE